MSGSSDKSIAFIKVEERRVIKKIEKMSNDVYGIKFIWIIHEY